ncbi:hypothetical protein [Caldifermentibacillus hisashii]|uniref:hypothetical protein n=1 Tax=Caldifermentibacillus hisashii TaxID=996558 RepID=UPI002DFFBC59|nr:hypothetical protein [Caldifermentibacillus hisashii]
MKLFKNFTRDEVEKSDGRVLARVDVKRIDRQTREINAFVVERASGKTVFKLRFLTTEAETDYAAYLAGTEFINKFVKEHDYIIDGQVDTNIDLPFVRVVENKSARW